MQELIDTLHNEPCHLVVLHEGNIHTYEGRGLRRLYNLSQEEPELLLGAKVAAQAVGRSAARVLAEGGVREVWADYLSEQAADVLEAAHVTTHCEKKLSHQAFLDLWERLKEC